MNKTDSHQIEVLFNITTLYAITVVSIFLCIVISFKGFFLKFFFLLPSDWAANWVKEKKNKWKNTNCAVILSGRGKRRRGGGGRLCFQARSRVSVSRLLSGRCWLHSMFLLSPMLAYGTGAQSVSQSAHSKGHKSKKLVLTSKFTPADRRSFGCHQQKKTPAAEGEGVGNWGGEADQYVWPACGNDTGKSAAPQLLC